MPNPMRLLANGERCELVFTLYRRSGVTEEDYERDAAWVARDLEYRLRHHLWSA